jgi:hypothetical protein
MKPILSILIVLFSTHFASANTLENGFTQNPWAFDEDAARIGTCPDSISFSNGGIVENSFCINENIPGMAGVSSSCWKLEGGVTDRSGVLTIQNFTGDNAYGTARFILGSDSHGATLTEIVTYEGEEPNLQCGFRPADYF